MTAITILMAALLATAAWQDLKTQLVSDWLTIPFCILGIIAAVIRGDFLSALIAAMLVLAVIFMPESSKIGGADIIVIAGFTAFFGLILLPNPLVLLCLLSLVIYAIEKVLKVSFIKKNNGIALLIPAFFTFIFYIWR